MRPCVCVCVTCFKLEKKTFKKTGPLDKYLRLLGQQSYLRMSKEIHETKTQGHPYKVHFSGFVWGSSFPCALAFWLHRLPANLHTDKQTSGPPVKYCFLWKSASSELTTQSYALCQFQTNDNQIITWNIY